MYKDVKTRILSGVLAALLVVSTLSVSANLLANYSADAEGVLQEGRIAQVFTASADYQKLTSASMQLELSSEESVSYTAAVYQNLTDASNPTSGVLRYESSTQTISGVSEDYAAQSLSIDLSSANIYLSNGETCAVVLTFSNLNGDIYYYTSDGAATGYYYDGSWGEQDAMMEVSLTTVSESSLSDGTTLTVGSTSVCVDAADTAKISATLSPALLRTITYQVNDSAPFTIESDGTVIPTSGTTGGTANVTILAPGASNTGSATVRVLASTLAEDSYTYTGETIAPDPVITCGDVTLTKGTNYNVTYANNVNAGTATATITGLGDYAGYSHVLTYTITPKTLGAAGDANFTINTATGEVTNGVYTLDGKSLTYGTDYTAEAEEKSISSASGKISYTYDITLTGMGNYTGTQTVTGYTVTAGSSATFDLSQVVSVKLDTTSYTFDGTEKKPSVTYYDMKGNQISGFENNCTIEYANNRDAGTATVTVRGVEANGYSGTLTAEFEIAACNLETADEAGSLTVTAAVGDTIADAFAYTGSAIRPTIAMTLAQEGNSVYTLTQNTDYTVSYTNNTAIGTMTVAISGAGTNFQGTIEREYEILGDFATDAQVQIGNGTAAVAYASGYASSYAVTYSGEEYKPAVAVKMGSSYLKQGTDYSIAYENNVNASTDSEKATVVITGLGKYADKEIRATFTIKQQTLGGTFKVSAKKTYNGQEITLSDGEYTLTNAGTTYTPGTDYTLSYANNTNAGTATVTATGTGNYTGTVKTTFKIATLDLEDSHIVVDPIADQTYTGNAIRPSVSIYYVDEDGTKRQIASSNYELTYADNKNRGTATITITGENNLSGSRTETFGIVAQTLAGKTYMVGGFEARQIAENTYICDYSTEYTGRAQQPAVVIKNGSSTIAKSGNYTVSYKNNKNVGTYSETTTSSAPYALIKGSGNYEGSQLTIYFTIAARDISDETTSGVTITATDELETLEDGSRVPVLSVKSSKTASKTLTKDIDYTITPGTDSTTSGEGKTAIVTGIGNYTGSREITYTIGSNIATGGTIVLSNPYTDAVYSVSQDGNYYISYLGRDANGDNVRPNSTLSYVDKTGTTTELTQNKDYTVSYATTTGGTGIVETVTITYTGMGDYYGTLTKVYNVAVVPMNSDSFVVKNADAGHSGDGFDYVYSGNAITPQLTVSYKITDSVTTTMVEGTDYTVVTTSVGPDVGTYVVQITGKGNYTGTLSATYTIAASDLSTCTLSSTQLADQTYTGKAITPSVADIAITNTSGATLTLGTDYRVKSYSNNVAIASYNDADAPTVVIEGIGNYTGTRNLTFNIVSKSLSDGSITISSIPDQIYTGAEVTPSVSVMYGDVLLTKDVDYTLTYTDNINPGKATITISGIGAYSSSVTTNFNIYGDLSDTTLFTIDGVKASYNLKADGKLDFSASTITVKFNGKTTTDASGNTVSAWLDSSNYTIEQYNCSLPGDGELVFVGKNYCRGTQSISIKVIGDLANATMTNIEDSYNYMGSTVQPSPLIKYGSQVLTLGTDYTLEYGTNTDVGATSGTIVARNVTNSYYTGSLTKNFAIYYNLTRATITGIQSTYDYDGTEKTPVPTIKIGGTQLLANTDYTVSYENNIEAGTATVTINSVSGRSIGAQALNFEIRGISMMDASMNITLDGNSASLSKEYTGDYIRPTVAVSYGSKTLRETSDYTISYANNLDAGTASVTVAGAGSYYGSVTKTFTITPKDIASSDLSVKVSDAGYAGGNSVVPAMSLSYNGHSLTEKTDYTYTLSNNTAVSTEASKAAVTFTGTGNYTGTRTENFLVTQVNLAGGTVTLVSASEVYTGSTITPRVVVTCPIGNGDNYTLLENVDYTISTGATSIVDAGSYSISITGVNNFYNALNTNFVVEPKAITSDDITVTVADMDYTGSAVIPDVTVTDTTRGVDLVEGTDYTLSYMNNTNSASKDDEDAAPTVTLIAKGNYTGTCTATFNIGKSIADASVRIAQSQQEYTYDGKEHLPDYAVYLGDTLLKEGTDYELIDIEDKVSAGTKTLAVKGIGNYYGKPSATYKINQKVAKADEINIVLDLAKDSDGNYITTYAGEAITPSVHVYDTSISTTKELATTDYSIVYTNNEKVGTVDNPAYVVVSLKGNYALGSETKSAPFIINERDISDFAIVLAEKRLSYTGSPITPELSVVYDNGVDSIITLTNGVDYDLTLTNNTNAGVATATVTAKGNYSGTLSADYAIVASLNDATVTVGTQFYTGEAIEPPVTVVCGGNTLTEGEDYKVDYYSDDNYTTSGYVIVTPLASYYSDSATATFEISSDMSLLEIKGYANRYTYTGSAIRPSITVEDPSGTQVTFDADSVVYARMSAADAASVTYEDVADLTQDDCINVGTITIFVPIEMAGKEKLLTATYEIAARNINSCDIIQLAKNTYTGKSIEPPVTLVYDGSELTLGTDYTVSYANNVNPGIGTATVIGTGNYTGRSVERFTIVPPAIVGASASPATETSVRISWLRHGAATGYEIYSEDNQTKYGTTSSTSFVANGLKSSTTYTFHVRSYVTVDGKTSYGEMKSVSGSTRVSSTNGLTVSSTTSKTATLEWDRSSTVGGYEIYRSTSANGSYSKIAVVPNGKGVYTDSKVRSGRTYYYKVRAYKPMNGSYVYGDYSEAIAITIK